MKKLFGFLLIIKFIILSCFIGCEKNEINDSTGKLLISLTDGPFVTDLIEEANITITKIEVRSKGDSASNPFIIISEDTMKFNLLDLRNGVTAKLVETDLPVGNYDLIRLYIDEASIKVKNGELYNLKTPSGAQSGIKIFIHPSIQVSGGLSSELLLDFCLDKSFVLKGNINTPAGIKGFNFKPVIRAVNNSSAGRISGFVTDTLKTKIFNAAVWLKKDTTVATSYSDSSGYYSIIGIPAGSYSLFAAKENFDTLKIENIKIISGNNTIQNLTLIPQ